MELLYFKTSLQRRREFQVKTGIYRCGSGRIVCKSAIYNEGIPHIVNIYQNEKKMRELLGNKVSDSKIEGEKLMVPFYQGISLGEKIRNAIIRSDFNAVIKYFDDWKKIIIGKGSNICKFYSTDDFIKIFGAADALLDEEALLLANIDCNSGNVIYMDDGNIKIIDFEWVYNFPVPLDYIWFRLIEVFYMANHDIISRHKLYDLANICENKIDIYNSLEQHFYEYITFDKENDINYAIFGDRFLKAQIIAKDLQRQYEVPEYSIDSGSKIVVYGAGNVGTEFKDYFEETNQYKIVAWVDKDYVKYCNNNLSVENPRELRDSEFDYLLICVASEHTANEIRQELLHIGISERKIIWEKPKLI